MKLVDDYPSSGRDRLVVEDEASCQRLLEKLPRIRSTAVDVETNVGHRTEQRAVSVQLFWGEEEIFVDEPYLPRLKPWINDNKPTGIFYGAKGDMWSLHNANLRWKGPVRDVMMEDYLVNENVKTIGEIEESIKKRHGAIFHHEPRKGYKQRFGQKGRPLPGADELLKSNRRQELIDYACSDSVETFEVHADRVKRLQKLPWKDDLSMYDYFERYSAPYTSVLYNMERRGCYIDTDFLEELDVKATGMLENIEGEFYRQARKAAGDLELIGFTDKLLGSWQQIGRLFYDVIGYPEQFKLTKDKHGQKIRKRTSDEDALVKLAAKGYPLAQLLNERRKIAKLHGTYVKGLLKQIRDHRLHTDFQQAFTLTGRLSSRDPNLQNIPRPDEDPFGIRYAFIATPGMLLLSMDYSQIETRLMAHMSNDPDMIAACEGADIYVTMAAFLFHKAMEFFAHPKEGEAGRMRQITKAIVLAVGFGKQAKSIASDLGISESEAENFLNMYFTRFGRFRAWMKATIRNCRNTGYVRTIHGRYRNIPEIRSSDKWIAMRAERQSLNSRIQGSAFDMMQKAQLNIASSGIEKEEGIHVILSVHDELLIEGPPAALKNPRVLTRLQEMLEHPFERDLRVRTPVSYKVGADWGSIH